MANPETCRDVLAELLARIDDWGGAGSLTGCGLMSDRIRAAIAADDAERWKTVAWTMMEDWAIEAMESRLVAERAAARLVCDVMEGWRNGARARLPEGRDDG